MISKIDAPVEFEVSIGNYGNVLDEQLVPSVSTTQPTNAVFDGCYYYYLPWSDNKPCLTVECSWEDVLFRLESMNLLQSIADRLASQSDTFLLLLLVPNSTTRTPAMDVLYNTTNGQAHNNSATCCTTNLPHRNA